MSRGRVCVGGLVLPSYSLLLRPGSVVNCFGVGSEEVSTQEHNFLNPIT